MSAAFDRALDEAFAACTATDQARFGPFVAEIRLTDEAERTAWMSAFAVRPGGVPADFSVAILQRPLAKVAALVPPARDEVHLSADGRYTALWQPAPHAMLHLYDHATRRGLLWIEDGDAPGWIRSRPILPIIYCFTMDTDWVPVHAAAVGQGERFLLLTGKGGAGKTTAALACAVAGWQYAGDDYVLIDVEAGQVAPLYSSARLRPPGRESFAGLLDETRIATSVMNGDHRDELRLAGHAIGAHVGGGRIAAWLIPDRQGADTPTLTAGRPSRAYQAMITATTIHPFGHERTAAKILKAIRLAPIFSADTGKRPELIAGAFERLLAELPA